MNWNRMERFFAPISILKASGTLSGCNGLAKKRIKTAEVRPPQLQAPKLRLHQVSVGTWGLWYGRKVVDEGRVVDGACRARVSLYRALGYSGSRPGRLPRTERCYGGDRWTFDAARRHVS